MNETRHHRRYRGSVIFPIILIVLGILFLLSNTGMITGDLWSIILSLWPVLLIAIGLDGILRREGLVGATFLIGVGVVILLSNFGYLALNVWELGLRLWPLLLIAIGFDVLVGRRSMVASLIGLVLILAILAGSLWAFGVRIDRGQALTGQQVSQPLDGAKSARVTLSPAAGSLHLGALSGSDGLVSGTVSSGRGQNVSQDFSRNGDTAVYTLRQSGGAYFFVPSADNWNWDLRLNPEIPTDLDVELGAGSLNLDLSQLNLTALKVDQGVGEVTVTLPAKGSLSGQINGAIGQIVILVPAQVAVRIQANTGLATVQVPSGYQKQDRTYTSPDYATAANRIDLQVSEAIGQVTVRPK